MHPALGLLCGGPPIRFGPISTTFHRRFSLLTTHTVYATSCWSAQPTLQIWFPMQSACNELNSLRMPAL